MDGESQQFLKNGISDKNICFRKLFNFLVAVKFNHYLCVIESFEEHYLTK